MPRRRRALIAAAALVGLAVVAGAVGAVAHRAAQRDVRLLFTGDILLSRQVAVERRRTGGSPWDSLAPLLHRADWVGGNLEGVIGPDFACTGAARELCFAFDEGAPKLLTAAGFDALTLENNHAADLGEAARGRTAHALAAAGLMPVDFAHSPRFVRVGDLTLALVAITLVPGADGSAQSIPSVEVGQRLRLARALANLVVVSIHWGTELQDWSNPAQRAAAAWLVDHGADVVFGHHPHVVQRPECLHGHPVFFSLGNHVFDQKYEETKDGLIAECRIRAGQLRCDGIRTHARRGSAVPVLRGTLDDPDLAGCAVQTHATMHVNGWTFRPEVWSRANSDSTGYVLEGWRDGALRWRTRRVALVSLAGVVGTDRGRRLLLTLERHPSRMDGENAIRPHVYDVSDRGLVAKWRGTALAWPLLDAVVEENGDVCALHRGDSFLRIDPSAAGTRTMRYRWDGFGFEAAPDSGGVCARRFSDSALAPPVSGHRILPGSGG